MKLKISKVGTRLKEVDESRSRRLSKSLTRLSLKIRRKELAEAKHQKVLKRSAEPPVPSKLPVSSTKVTLNVIGNRIGMHNAGDSEHMRKIRAMRKIYNKQMPVLSCSGCSFQNVCPQFKAGYECAYLPFLNSHKVESERDLIDYMKELLGSGMRRMHQALMMETMSGAPPSVENSEQLSMLFNQFKEFHDIVSSKSELSIETEDTTIIGRLFGGLDKLLDHTKDVQANPIDVAPVKMVEDALHADATSELDLLSGGVDTELIKDHARDELIPLALRKEENART